MNPSASVLDELVDRFSREWVEGRPQQAGAYVGQVVPELRVATFVP